MSSDIDYAGLPLFIHLHKVFNIPSDLAAHPKQDEMLRVAYEGLREDAIALWCSFARHEELPLPEQNWASFPDEVKEFWRLRSLIVHPWNNHPGHTIDDPGYELFHSRHQHAMAFYPSVLDQTEYNDRPLPQVWADLHPMTQGLWRCEATGMLLPSSPTTDPVKLWSDWCAPAEQDPDLKDEDFSYDDTKIAFEQEPPTMRNFWVLKALALQEMGLA